MGLAVLDGEWQTEAASKTANPCLGKPSTERLVENTEDTYYLVLPATPAVAGHATSEVSGGASSTDQE